MPWDQIKIVDNFLEYPEIVSFVSDAEQYKWEFINRSNGYVFVFWVKNLFENKNLVNFFKEKVEKTTGLSLEPIKLIINGQSYGQCGEFHTDIDVSDPKEAITAVWFPPLYDYNINMGGHLVIQDKDDYQSILPIPNRLVIFNSKTLHVGLEPTRFCTTMRTSVSFKCLINEVSTS